MPLDFVFKNKRGSATVSHDILRGRGGVTEMSQIITSESKITETSSFRKGQELVARFWIGEKCNRY